MMPLALALVLVVLAFVPFVLAALAPRTRGPEWTPEGLRWRIQYLSRPLVWLAIAVGETVGVGLVLLTAACWRVTTLPVGAPFVPNPVFQPAPWWVWLLGAATLGVWCLLPTIPVVARFVRATLRVGDDGVRWEGFVGATHWAWADVDTVIPVGQALAIREVGGATAKVRVPGARAADLEHVAARLTEQARRAGGRFSGN